MSEKNSILNLPKISGLILKNISIAFEDYTSNKEGFKRGMEYYIFNYQIENETKIIVEISYDENVISKKQGIKLFVGGGAKYTMDLDTQKIIDKTWYK